MGARGTKILTSSVNLTPGQSTTVGELRFNLDSIDPKGGFAETPYKMNFRVFGPSEAVKDLQVLDSEGNRIPRFRPLAPRLTTIGKERFHYLDLYLAEEPPKDSELWVEVWTDLSDYLVPVELTFALDLGSSDSRSKENH